LVIQNLSGVKKLITAKSYFSGAGGLILGIIEAGIDVIESDEVFEDT